MSTPLFTALSAALTTADSLTLKIVSGEDDKIKVVLLPKLADEFKPEGKDAELRAALALPLVMEDAPEVLDESFVDLVRDYATQRASLQQSLATMDVLREANEKARKQPKGAAAKSAGKAGAKTPEPAAEAEAEAASSVQASDDDILF